MSVMMPGLFVVCAPGWRSPDRAIAGHRNALGGDTKSPKRSAGMGRRGWMAMGQAEAFKGRFSPTFLLTLAAAGIASAAAVGVLYAIHAVQVSDVAGRSAELTALHTTLGDGLSAEERRELTRQMLKARRENREIPAQVRPTPSSRPATSGTADAAAPAAPAAPAGAAGAAGAKVRPDRLGTAPAVAAGSPPGPGVPPAARGAVRNKPDAQVQTAALPPAASPAASAAVGLAPGAAPPAPAAPATAPPVASTSGAALPPVVVSIPGVTPPPGLIVGEPNARAQAGGDPAAGAAGAAASEPERRSFAAGVFSTISGFAGTAANATGNTVNWVIELPGKAISAGGRLLGGDSASGNPPPAAQPAPNRS
jgi:hypothetical protein